MIAAEHDRGGSCPHGSVSLLRAELRRDIARHVTHSDHRDATRRAAWIEALSALLTPHMLAVLGYRLAHLAQARGWHGAARRLSWLNQLLHKSCLTPSSCIGGGLFLPHPPGILFHGRAGRDLTLYSHALCAPADGRPWSPLEAAPVLGDGVTIGVLGAVLGAVQVGNGACVGPRSSVLTDLPAGSTAISRALRVVVNAQPSEPHARDNTPGDGDAAP